jgi:hypothetical protein
MAGQQLWPAIFLRPNDNPYGPIDFGISFFSRTWAISGNFKGRARDQCSGTDGPTPHPPNGNAANDIFP